MNCFGKEFPIYSKQCLIFKHFILQYLQEKNSDEQTKYPHRKVRIFCCGENGLPHQCAHWFAMTCSFVLPLSLRSRPQAHASEQPRNARLLASRKERSDCGNLMAVSSAYYTDMLLRLPRWADALLAMTCSFVLPLSLRSRPQAHASEQPRNARLLASRKERSDCGNLMAVSPTYYIDMLLRLPRRIFSNPPRNDMLAGSVCAWAIMHNRLIEIMKE